MVGVGCLFGSVDSLLTWTGQSGWLVSSPELSLKGLGGPRFERQKSSRLMSFCRDGEGSSTFSTLREIKVGNGQARGRMSLLVR